MAGGVNQYMVSSGGHMPRSTLNALLGDQNGHIKSVESRETLIESIEEPDPLRRARLYDVITYLPPLFMRQDKMSMAASIENRVPFAVPRVYQFALSLARGDLVSLRGRKLLLKRLLELYFPRRLVQRKKWGFGIPIHRWFAAAPGRERLHSLVQPESRLRDELDPRYVEQLVRSFRGGLPDANVLFTLLSFHTWLTVRGSKPPRSENGNACEYGYSAMVSM
jgi:asparagine synthase (glutamine-hydrolysing)